MKSWRDRRRREHISCHKLYRFFILVHRFWMLQQKLFWRRLLSNPYLSIWTDVINPTSHVLITIGLRVVFKPSCFVSIIQLLLSLQNTSIHHWHVTFLFIIRSGTFVSTQCPFDVILSRRWMKFFIGWLHSRSTGTKRDNLLSDWSIFCNLLVHSWSQLMTSLT